MTRKDVTGREYYADSGRLVDDTETFVSAYYCRKHILEEYAKSNGPTEKLICVDVGDGFRAMTRSERQSYRDSTGRVPRRHTKWER